MATTSNLKNGGAQVARKFPVFMLHSSWSLSRLDEFLASYGDDVGSLRVVFNNKGEETPRTIALFSEHLYEALCRDGFDHHQYGRNLTVSEFVLKDNNYPGEGRTKTLFVPVPNVLSEDENVVVAAVSDKLKHLAEWNIVPAGSWSINVPIKSREKGGVRSGCFISFKRDVSLDEIAMTRVLLTDTYWPESTDGSYVERPAFRCFWARDRKQHEENTVVPDSAGLGTKDEKPAKDETQSKEDKKKKSIQNFVKQARPVNNKSRVKTTRVHLASSQPTPLDVKTSEQ
jgi:hypothetical protein